MKIGVLGTGEVGKALGKGFLALGHEVKLGARDAKNEKAAAWVEESGPRASAGTFADAAAFAEVAVLATLGSANRSALELARPDNLKGKTLIDATNPLDFSRGFPPSLALSGSDSGGEQVQRLAPGARVVKALNFIGNVNMFKPEFVGGPPDMFICGNDDGGKKQVMSLLKDFGWNATDLGGIEYARYLEALAMIWVLYAAKTNQWNHVFKVLRK